jgi:transcriptional regulator GlxA family with amidase domain
MISPSARLLEAKRCLLHTGMNVDLIAECRGFDHPAYFSRFFARATRANNRVLASATITFLMCLRKRDHLLAFKNPLKFATDIEAFLKIVGR